MGYEALSEHLAAVGVAIIDGYGGIFWPQFQQRLSEALQAKGIDVHWMAVSEALRPPSEIEALVSPYLGGDDPLFGTRYTGTLMDFFDPLQLEGLRPRDSADLNIIYGCGAALAGWEGLLVYIDLPKNEVQFRSRAGAITNLGVAKPQPAKEMYKRFYFVDWIVLNRHKETLLKTIGMIVDGQRPDEPLFTSGATLRSALAEMSRTVFRVRPWFEPGPWGGHWLKQKITQLPQDVPNYAWSFEFIAPENGLLLASDDRLLEISFDFLMFAGHQAILGDFADAFQFEFPIRFDYLDTMDGGNLSLQCHPRPDFIRHQFGETFTQDETYYIVDCEPDARVYLGFNEDIDPVAFRTALERSYHDNVPVDVDRFVNIESAHQHDLFLIPNGTIHCSGAGNLVLEISATPYIFTFKLYDWLRLDLNGRPRPLNIARAFENLAFDRQASYVKEHLVSKSVLLEAGAGWRLFHLPTHDDHFYDVHRLEFETAVELHTAGSPHVLNLVEGSSLSVEVGGISQRFNFAETFVIPAAADHYRLSNEGEGTAKVVKAFMKAGYAYR